MHKLSSLYSSFHIIISSIFAQAISLFTYLPSYQPTYVGMYVCMYVHYQFRSYHTM